MKNLFTLFLCLTGIALIFLSIYVVMYVSFAFMPGAVMLLIVLWFIEDKTTEVLGSSKQNRKA